MEAILLVGGSGKRLRPITDYIPKPLIPLDNIPILEWQIKYLKNNGIDKIIICTGYKAKMIENFLVMKNNFGIEIKFSKEKVPLGTGGAIKKAGALIKNESFIVLNGDIITDMKISKLMQKPNSIASVELKTKFGIMEIENEKIIQFREKEEISGVWMNAGMYHLPKESLKDLPEKGDIEKTLFPKYANKRKLNVVKFRNTNWYSIDSFKDMEECSAVISKIIT